MGLTHNPDEYVVSCVSVGHTHSSDEYVVSCCGPYTHDEYVVSYELLWIILTALTSMF